jgi:hypothetical protein
MLDANLINYSHNKDNLMKNVCYDMNIFLLFTKCDKISTPNCLISGGIVLSESIKLFVYNVCTAKL